MIVFLSVTWPSSHDVYQVSHFVPVYPVLNPDFLFEMLLVLSSADTKVSWNRVDPIKFRTSLIKRLKLLNINI